MCGRYVISSDPAAFAEYFGVEEIKTEELAPSYNVAPTDQVYGIAQHGGERQLGSFRWGLIPHWSKNRKGPLNINARAESVASKPTFRDSFRMRRCILPADGFFEWEPKERHMPPHYVTMSQGRPMGFAGVWASWKDPETDSWLRSCAIITTTANPVLAPIHTRMPVILLPDRWDQWLERDNHDTASLEKLLIPIPKDQVAEHTVSTLVNRVANNLPENILPLGDRPS